MLSPVWWFFMIAYLILVHRYPEQFKRLFKAIYDRENYYAIHIDKRSDLSVHLAVQKFLTAFPNALLIESKSALWGGYSLVDAELRGIKALLAMSTKWKYFLNISGQDFPLKTQQQIKKFLKKNIGKDFLKVANQREVRPGTLSRIEQYCIEWKNTVFRTWFKRRFLKDATPYIGNQWMILSRKFCKFLCTSPEIPRFEKFYQNTFIADESFFQTVIMNTSYRPNIVNDDMRAIDWVPEGTIKLRPRTFTARDAKSLLASKNLFARKLDMTVDKKIFRILEAHLAKG